LRHTVNNRFCGGTSTTYFVEDGVAGIEIISVGAVGGLFFGAVAKVVVGEVEGVVWDGWHEGGAVGVLVVYLGETVLGVVGAGDLFVCFV